MKNAVVILFCFLLVQLNAQDSFTLAEAMAYGVQNQTEIKRQLLEITDADKRIREFIAIGLPQIDGTAEWTRNIDLFGNVIPAGSFDPGEPGVRDPFPAQDAFAAFGTKHNITAGLSGNTLLFDGSFLVGLQANRLFKQLKQKELIVTKDAVAYNIATSYMTALVSQARIKIIDKNIENLEKTQYETSQIYESGFAEKLDVDRLDLSLANLRIERQKAESVLQTTLNLLKFSMGYDVEADIQLSDNIADMLPANDNNLALLDATVTAENRSEYDQLLTAKDLLDLNVKQIKAQYLPSLRAFGYYNQVQQGDRFLRGDWIPVSAVGLTLSLPIYDGGDKASKLDRAKISIDQQLREIDNFEQATLMEIQNAKLSLSNAIQTLQTSEDSEILATDIYETTQIKYREGVGSSIEVSQAESELYQTQGNYLSALYDVLIAQTDLEKALGILKY